MWTRTHGSWMILGNSLTSTNIPQQQQQQQQQANMPAGHPPWWPIWKQASKRSCWPTLAPESKLETQMSPWTMEALTAGLHSLRTSFSKSNEIKGPSNRSFARLIKQSCKSKPRSMEWKARWISCRSRWSTKTISSPRPWTGKCPNRWIA